MRGRGATPLKTLRGGLSPSRRQVLVPRSDYRTSGEIPRDRTHVGFTTIKVALWNVNGAPSREEEIGEMMCKTNASCGIITERWLRPGQELNCAYKTYRTDDVPRSGRPAVGIAILPCKKTRATVMRRYVQNELNALWVRIHNGVDIIAVYVRPGADSRILKEFMGDNGRRARYPF